MAKSKWESHFHSQVTKQWGICFHDSVPQFRPHLLSECSAALNDVTPIFKSENKWNIGTQYLIGVPGFVWRISLFLLRHKLQTAWHTSLPIRLTQAITLNINMIPSLSKKSVTSTDKAPNHKTWINQLPTLHSKTENGIWAQWEGKFIFWEQEPNRSVSINVYPKLLCRTHEADCILAKH